MYGLHISEALTCIANFQGWDKFKSFFMPGRALAKMYWRRALKPMYANRTWPEKPVVLWLPNGQLWQVHEDGTVEPFDRSVAGPKKLEGS